MDMPGYMTILRLTQVSFDVAWSAEGIDGRYYEYKKIASYSDVIFIMAYDEQSQIINGPCTARYVEHVHQIGNNMTACQDFSKSASSTASL